jgi:hypothetical protein
MAIEIFVGGGEFREGFAGRAEEENGIVTETADASGSREDFAFDGAGENGDHAATEGQREHANEARAAVARPARLHLGEELGDAIGRGGVRTSVAGRIHAGFAAESIDDEPGIVGEHGKGGKSAVVQGLARGVLGKGGRGFLEWLESGKIWQKLEVDVNCGRRPGGERAKFVQFARIGRREKQTTGLGATRIASGREH